MFWWCRWFGFDGGFVYLLTWRFCGADVVQVSCGVLVLIVGLMGGFGILAWRCVWRVVGWV